MPTEPQPGVPAAEPPPPEAAPAGEAPPSLPEGALSALLQELAAEPPGGLGQEWQLAPVPGQSVGRFRIVREIGRGGFGVVYEAEDRTLGRSVALKAVRTGGRAALRQERLLREAEAAARLSHPNIVTIFDLGQWEQGPYLVLELLVGQSLAARLAAGPVPVAEAVRIATAVARGLAHAHERGVIHRDLTPGNVFLPDGGGVKVLDFGLAHAFGHQRVAGGTPDYMAPEQAAGAPEDERTDVFSLGVMLYRMLTGSLPFPGGDDRKALLSAPPAPALEVPGLPALGALVGRMLRKSPVERPRDGGEVLRALEALGEELGPSGEAGPVRARRRPWLRTWAFVAAGVLAGGAGFAIWRHYREDAARTGAAAERVVVAVADVANDTGDQELDTLSGLLITSLEQSRRLSVLTRARMIDLARQAGSAEPGRIDELLGREICRRGLARALLVAGVHRLGAMYSIDLRALDPDQEAYLFTLQERASSKEELLGAIDRLSEAARRALHEPAREVSGSRLRTADVAMANLPAYRRYAEGRDHLARLRFAEAAVEFRAALAIAPDFALAHLELARMGSVGELTPEDRERHARETLRLQDRLPPKERRLFQAWRAARDGQLAPSEATYRALAADFPSDKDVMRELGGVLVDRGQPELAVPFLERALILDPANFSIGAELLEVLNWLGRDEEGLAMARKARAAVPGAQTAVLEAFALANVGRPAESARLARDGLALGEPQGRAILIGALLRAGDLDALEALVGELVASPDRALQHQGQLARMSLALARGRRAGVMSAVEASRTAPGTVYAAHQSRWRLATFLGLGDAAEVRREARTLSGLDPVLGAQQAAFVAWWGDLESAALLARALGAGTPDAALYQAAVDWRGGRREPALAALRELSRTHASGNFLDVLLHGEAALEAGLPGEAAAALRRFQSLQSSVRWESWTQPLGALRLARAELRLGHPERARAALEPLARQWRGADRDFRLAAELRALQAELDR